MKFWWHQTAIWHALYLWSIIKEFQVQIPSDGHQCPSLCVSDDWKQDFLHGTHSFSEFTQIFLPFTVWHLQEWLQNTILPVWVWIYSRWNWKTLLCAAFTHHKIPGQTIRHREFPCIWFLSNHFVRFLIKNTEIYYKHM